MSIDFYIISEHRSYLVEGKARQKRLPTSIGNNRKMGKYGKREMGKEKNRTWERNCLPLS